MKAFSSHAMLYLAAFSGCVLFSYNTALKRNVGGGRSLKENSSALALADTKEMIEMEDGRRLDANDYIEQRIMEVFKDTWPECTKQNMHALDCKQFIDEEIITTFTGRDRYIRVILRDKRKKWDDWYNTVVIHINDRHMTVGRDGDGIAYYDFEWDGDGEPATPEEETEIPPVYAFVTDAGAPDADPNVVGPAGDPSSPEYHPLEIEPEPIYVIGATVGGAASGGDKNPIAGGVVTNPDDPNDPEGDDKLVAAKQEAEDNTDPETGLPVVPPAGPRFLPAFDCNGLTGYYCCLMIKLKVRDRDNQHKAIQCQIIYEEESTKEKYYLNLRGKKVIVFANHNDIVSKIPKIVGGWPKGQDQFGDWLEDGGDPNREDWIPPNDI